MAIYFCRNGHKHRSQEATISCRCCRRNDRKIIERNRAKNRYGVDVAYFTKELAALSRSLDDRKPDELERYLLRLADVARRH